MAREDNKIIPMIFDETFYRKMAIQNGNNKIIIKQQITIAKCSNCHLKIMIFNYIMHNV